MFPLNFYDKINLKCHTSVAGDQYSEDEEEEKTKIGLVPMSKWNFDDIMHRFTDNTGNVCIDGMSCSGKTTILSKFHKIFKINTVLDTTNYNYNSVTAFSYLEMQNYIYNKNRNLVFDRSPISNLAFQLVYWLMENYDERVNFSSYNWCENYVRMHNMKNALEYIKSRNYNIIIVVNSNLDEWQKYMLMRNGTGDRYKGCVREYGECQLFAYIYLAQVLNLPILDHRNGQFASNVNLIERCIAANFNASCTDESIITVDKYDNYKCNEVELKMMARKYTKR